MSVGYSGTPLAKKLGLKPAMRCCLVDGPGHYAEWIGDGFYEVQWFGLQARRMDFIHGFFTERKKLEKQLPRMQGKLNDSGMLWLSWPKKSSGVKTDLNENVLREIALPMGLVDIKVCAVNEIWSGLKFVIRKELRQS